VQQQNNPSLLNYVYSSAVSGIAPIFLQASISN
jgi:hypothetical protein